MDLLGGYGSDDASSGSDGDAPPPDPPPPPPKSDASDSAPSQKLPSSSSAPSNKPSAGAARPRVSRRGRRLVSLGAVLPPEIFERLTRKDAGEGIGGGGSSSSSSSPSDEDDDGSDDGGDGSKKKKSRSRRGEGAGRKGDGAAGEEDNKERSIRAADGAMDDLLQDLRSAPRAEKSGAGEKDLQSKKEPETEKMGFAFMQSSTTVVRKKRRRGTSENNDDADSDDGEENEEDEEDVEDVHAPTEYARRKAAEAEETAGARHEAGVGNADLGRSSMATTATTARISAAPPAVRAASLSSASSKAPPAGFAPRTVAAAPRVASAVPPTAHYPAVGVSTVASGGTSAPPPASHAYEEETAPPAATTKKKSKRHLSRALRSGDFSSLSDGGQTVTLDHSVDHYTPTDSDLALTASRSAAAAAAKRGARGIRMYDPRAGGDVDTMGEVDVKHRRKHQINQLASRAAALEAQRLGEGMGRTVKGSASRADAKRKYGW